MAAMSVEDHEREARLMRDLAIAREAYEQTKAACARLMEQAKDIQNLNHPDGSLSMRKAIQSQSAATERYANALKSLSDFILSKPIR